MPVDPRMLSIVNYPYPSLRERATPLPTPITDEVRLVARRMLELMRDSHGIGLAAPQVGLSWRLFVVDIPPSDPPPTPHTPHDPDNLDDPDDSFPSLLDPAFAHLPTDSGGERVYINPVLSHFKGTPELMEEGCLSLPDIRGELLRPPVVTLTALDLDGRETTLTAAGLLARCWQHEMDHLDGKLIIDKFIPRSRLKNQAAVKRLERSFVS